MDEQRPGRAPSISLDQVEDVVVTTLDRSWSAWWSRSMSRSIDPRMHGVGGTFILCGREDLRCVEPATTAGAPRQVHRFVAGGIVRRWLRSTLAPSADKHQLGSLVSLHRQERPSIRSMTPDTSMRWFSGVVPDISEAAALIIKLRNKTLLTAPAPATVPA